MVINSGCCFHIHYGAARQAVRTHSYTILQKRVELSVVYGVSF